MVSKQQLERNVGGSGRRLILGATPRYASNDWGKPRKLSEWLA